MISKEQLSQGGQERNIPEEIGKKNNMNQNRHKKKRIISQSW